MRKFSGVSSYLGSGMKSVGEVMAIDRKFEAAFNKGLRMMDDSLDGFGDIPEIFAKLSIGDLEHALSKPNDKRIIAVAEALNREYTVNKLHELTKIDRWFLYKMHNIIFLQKILCMRTVDTLEDELLIHVKRCGFSDKQIARCLESSELLVRKHRQDLGFLPFVKQIDTLAAEYPAKTNYLYMTYNASAHDLEFKDHGVMVLGCGAYRIGSSCEFD